MKIVVTGARGLVGSNLYTRLLSEGHDVYCPDFNLHDKEKLMDYIGFVRPDVIYHLAANASESQGQKSPINMTENNINIFINVLAASIKANTSRFIYTSSVAVYGEATVPYKEEGDTKPMDVYGVNKLACEQILKIMAKVYGFEYTIFRPHNIYGPGQNMADPTRNVVAQFMRKMIEKGSLTLYGEGKMRRAFSYVDDVVDVLVKSIDGSFADQTVNLGSDKDISIKELVDLLTKITEKNVEMELVPARSQEISMFLADHSLQNRLTEYKETSIEEGLRKTWEWVKQHPLPELKKKEVEIHEPI